LAFAAATLIATGFVVVHLIVMGFHDHYIAAQTTIFFLVASTIL
jgi:hypothetical protein